MVNSIHIEFYDIEKSILITEDKQFYKSRSQAEEVKCLMQVHVPGLWFCWDLKSALQSPVLSETPWVMCMFSQGSISSDFFNEMYLKYYRCQLVALFSHLTYF